MTTKSINKSAKWKKNYETYVLFLSIFAKWLICQINCHIQKRPAQYLERQNAVAVSFLICIFWAYLLALPGLSFFDVIPSIHNFWTCALRRIMRDNPLMGLFGKWLTLDPKSFYAIPFRKLVFFVSLYPEFLEKM